jgi:hypothetical protein
MSFKELKRLFSGVMTTLRMDRIMGVRDCRVPDTSLDS